MEEAIKKRYSEEILETARQRYGIAASKIKMLDGYESFIFEYEKSDQAFILRLGHSRRRSVALIQGEVDWINFLAANGAGVAQAILSEAGSLVEPIDDGFGDQFLATAFVKARGGWADPTRFWQPGLLENYGRLLGKLHRLSMAYEPTNPIWKRPDWNDPINMDIHNVLPEGNECVLEKSIQLRDHLESLPTTDRRSFGLIHQDTHAGNFFVDENNEITLFDFDDSTYMWFVTDIAMSIFYAVIDKKDMAAATRRFITPFMAGYRQEHSLDQFWLAQIPYLLKLREIDLFAYISRDFDLESTDDNWVSRYMNGRKEKIEKDIPTIDYDFANI